MNPNRINPTPGNITHYDYNGFLQTTVCSILVSVGFGLLWLSIVQLIPKWAPKIAAGLAVLGLLTVGIFCFFLRTTYKISNIQDIGLQWLVEVYVRRAGHRSCHHNRDLSYCLLTWAQFPRFAAQIRLSISLTPPSQLLPNLSLHLTNNSSHSSNNIPTSIFQSPLQQQQQSIWFDQPWSTRLS